MQLLLGQLNEGTEVLMVLPITLFAGFIMTGLTSTPNPPKVSGYVLAGILIGPCCLSFISVPIITHMGFISDSALVFIASEVRKFFKREVLLRTGKRILVITLFEVLSADVMVILFLRFIFSLDWGFALVPGAIATAAAPVSTMITINQYKAKGEFVDTLLQIATLGDVVRPSVFSVTSAIASGRAPNGISAESIITPLVFNLLAILLGLFYRYFLSRLLVPGRSRGNRLILTIVALLGISGIYVAASILPPLSCIVLGAAYINLTEGKKLFRQISNSTPPAVSMFFIASGVNLDAYALSTVDVIGSSYFIVRIMRKYMGAYISCLMTNISIEIRNFMGLALILQAGVVIDLTFLGQRPLPPRIENLILTIILPSSVSYEMIGPISAELALISSGNISSGRLLGTLPREGEADENSGVITVFSLIPASGLSQKDGESLAQIMEGLNAGVDEGDDDGTENVTPLEEQKEKKKKSEKEHKKRREEIVEVPLEGNIWVGRRE